MKTSNQKKIIFTLLIASYLSLYSGFLQAAPRPSLPSTIDPGQIGRELSREIPGQYGQPNLLRVPLRPGQGFPSTVSKFKFKLKEIRIVDPIIFSAEELIEPYKKYFCKTITLSELQEIVKGMTNRYQMAGYALTQVIIPPQRIKNGKVTLKVVSGHIGDITLSGDIHCDTRVMLENYASKMYVKDTLHMPCMERYLLLMNDIPGVKVQAVFTPSKHIKGATDIHLIAKEHFESANLGINNYGTKFLGPIQYLAGIEEDSLFNPGDLNQGQMITTGNNELNFVQFRHTELLNYEGSWFEVLARYLRTVPGSTLDPLDIQGKNKVALIDFQHPYIRSRKENLTFHGGFMFNDSTAKVLGVPFYGDRIRPLSAGFLYNYWDSMGGVSQFEVLLSQGLKILSASGHTHISRPTGRSAFTKINSTLSHQQKIVDEWSLFGLVTAQYSFNSLLAVSQFGVGGSFIGRGYDPSEILGDSGIAATLELRYDIAPRSDFCPPFQKLGTQVYLFLDGGRIWNKDNSTGIKRDSLSSTGIGVRFNLPYENMTRFDANFYIAKPLSRIVTAYRDKRARFYFAINMKT